MSHLRTAFAIVVAALLAASPAAAQEGYLTEIYGQGVHAFFANNAQQVVPAVESGDWRRNQGPAGLLFSGACWTAVGATTRPAISKWGPGWRLSPDGGDIGRSLQRVQGGLRLKLEQYRRQARLEAAQNAASRAQTRRSAADAAKSRVAEPADNAVLPPAGDAFAEPPPAGSGDDTAPMGNEVFGNPTPPTDPPAGGANPFGGAPAGNPPPAGGNPFGAPAGNPPPAGDGGNPFGGAPAGNPPAGDGGNPFGGAPAGNPPPAGDGGNPFGRRSGWSSARRRWWQSLRRRSGRQSSSARRRRWQSLRWRSGW